MKHDSLRNLLNVFTIKYSFVQKIFRSKAIAYQNIISIRTDCASNEKIKYVLNISRVVITSPIKNHA